MLQFRPGVELRYFVRVSLPEVDLETSPVDVTSLLHQLADGDQEAAAKLIPLVYETLRRLAVRRLRHERPNHTLQATALVHEAYMRLAAQENVKWQNRAQFYAVASQLMRRILVDYARGQQRIRRGGKQQKVPLDDVWLISQDRTDELLALHECLSMLAKLDGRQSRIVELRLFGGLSIKEIAEVLAISTKTVTRDWLTARAWLQRQLLRKGEASSVGAGQV